MASPPSAKRQRTTAPSASSAPSIEPPPAPQPAGSSSSAQPTNTAAAVSTSVSAPPGDAESHASIPASTAHNPRKRRASHSSGTEVNRPGPPAMETDEKPAAAAPKRDVEIDSERKPEPEQPEGSAKKKTRTNTPWTPGEEQKLKQLRDQNKTWGEIAKEFPNRTEGSVKKHWYKDMHYAEFAEEESQKLLEAIKEYDANKWKVIGGKLGKPAKACEQYAKEHFPSLFNGK